MRKLPLIGLALVIAALGLAACGSDDDGDETAETAETTTEATTTEAAGGDAGGSGETVSVEADPNGDLAYVESSLSASAGEATFDFSNPASIPHDFRVEQDGSDIGGTEVISESDESVTLDLEAGEYTYFCSVPGHREAGMEGTLTVK